MKPTIERICTPTSAEWDAVWNACDSATFFHSRWWAELWQRYAPRKHTPMPQWVLFSDGKRALLPIVRTKHARGLIDIHELSCAGTFGGWLSADELTAEHAHVLAEYIVLLPNVHWMTNPYDPLQMTAVGNQGSQGHTSRFDLREPFSVLHQRMNKHQIPRMCRAAARQGLTLAPLHHEDLPVFLSIYRDCAKRWRDPVTYGSALFELLLKTQGCDFWGVSLPSGELVCGLITMRSKRHVGGWLEVTRSVHLRLHPYELANYQLIQHYQAQGYWWFDFLPSGGRSSVDDFKRRFGTEAVRLRHIRRSSLAHQVAEQMHTWRVSVARRFGASAPLGQLTVGQP